MERAEEGRTTAGVREGRVRASFCAPVTRRPDVSVLRLGGSGLE